MTLQMMHRAQAVAPAALTQHNTDSLTLCHAFTARDGRGRSWQVGSIEMCAEGFCPDVYVNVVGGGVIDSEIYDDDAFIADVMAQLCKIGFDGPPFGRRELGAQSDECIVLEGNYAFGYFAVRLGWRKLGYGD